MSEKEKLIQELIEGQKQFMSEINDAHKQYLSEYESKSVVADITAGGSWLSEENETDKKK